MCDEVRVIADQAAAKAVSLWCFGAERFLCSMLTGHKGLAKSTAAGPATLYGTCYVKLGLHYTGNSPEILDMTAAFIKQCQDPESGLLIGPELVGFETSPGVLHDREHLLLHLACAVIPVCQQFGIKLRPIIAAHRYCDLNYLAQWTEARDWKNAWFEGNNILFVGQLLVYLRDVERYPGAEAALQFWFDWLDRTIDPKTGLWGTNEFCSPMEAVYGGYHQLLVYYHENHPLPNPRGLVDTVLSLQHSDGGFNPHGNGGACEDVDSVDILVNCYKRCDYRRADIRFAIRRCVRHILDTQNPDGGFPYNCDQPQSHMGVPGTQAEPNVSCAFPTWFRIHTLALCAEVLPSHPELRDISFRFNRYLSMGWHASPPGWRSIDDSIGWEERRAAMRLGLRKSRQKVRRVLDSGRSLAGRAARKGLRISGSAIRRSGLKR